MFRKILIANRGEIAVRIIRACKEMGIQTVAVFSEADREALHVHLADEAFCIGPASVSESYLNTAAILTAALQTGAQAVHPGYGLLSENAAFAEACTHCGLTFIGPGAEVISRMGDKAAAIAAMKEANVPVIPGSGLLQSPREAEEAAQKLGCPVLLKARAGGGGRGIRRIESPAECAHAYATAFAESKAAFGDGALYMEKCVYPARHIEVQVLFDQHGHGVALGERECSLQRRNQKLLEESPSPGLTPKAREKLFSIALRACKAVGYVNAGTVEFLQDAEGNHYFMEMNTRLQVEHPVTEMVTGIDLVQWQIRIAAGAKLPLSQAEVTLKGHAIECRINAENPAHNHRPSAGTISLLHVPGGPGVRFDTSIYQGYFVPPFYDSLLGKLIVHAQTRPEAIRKMQAALSELVIEGVEHNAELHRELTADAAFMQGEYHTGFLAERKS